MSKAHFLCEKCLSPTLCDFKFWAQTSAQNEERREFGMEFYQF